LFDRINCFIVEIFLKLLGTYLPQLHSAVQKEELIEMLPIRVPNQFELFSKISLKVLDDLYGPGISLYPDEGIK
jgi:hypothetical protein